MSARVRFAVPGTRADRPVSAAKSLLAASLALLLGACGGESARQQALLERVEKAYAEQLRFDRPDYVVVTYPETPDALEGLKRGEFACIQRVLNKLGIPFETCSRSDAIETLNNVHATKAENKVFQAFRIPKPALDRAPNAVLLYLNLDVRKNIKTSLNPLARKNKIEVRVWNDPMATS